jgi:hypothetical protein
MGAHTTGGLTPPIKDCWPATILEKRRDKGEERRETEKSKKNRRERQEGTREHCCRPARVAVTQPAAHEPVMRKCSKCMRPYKKREVIREESMKNRRELT